MTKIAIYICDRIDDCLPQGVNAWPTVGDELLQIDSSLTVTEYDVFREQYPTHMDFDAVIIPGARDSALDINKKPWIKKLSDHVKLLYQAQKPLIGICFGHQVISHSLGGTVSKKIGGMHIGLESISLHSPRPSFLKELTTFNAAYIHEDTVTAPPKQATLLGSSVHDSHSFYHINNQVLSMQFHPDFSPHTLQQFFGCLPFLKEVPLSQQKQTTRLSDYQRILRLILDFIYQTA